jgi:DNA-directed RNA polymerase subunit H (RpoH/RPB5)
MHVLQPKIFKLKETDVEKLLEKYNISISQLPKISLIDPQLPEGAKIGDVFKFDREHEDEEVEEYFRAVI